MLGPSPLECVRRAAVRRGVFVGSNGVRLVGGGGGARQGPGRPGRDPGIGGGGDRTGVGDRRDRPRGAAPWDPPGGVPDPASLAAAGADEPGGVGLAALRRYDAGHHGYRRCVAIVGRLYPYRRGRRRAGRRAGNARRHAPIHAHGGADARPAGGADHVRHEGGRRARRARPLARAARRGASGRGGGPAVRGGGHVGGLRPAECRDAPPRRRDPGPRL